MDGSLRETNIDLVQVVSSPSGYPATRFEYKINMLVPILYGFLLTAAIVVASAFVDGREVIVLSGRRASMYVAMIAAFIFSIIKCLCCHFKMIASVTKE